MRGVIDVEFGEVVQLRRVAREAAELAYVETVRASMRARGGGGSYLLRLAMLRG